MPTGNPGQPNPKKRPKYRDIPEHERCRAQLTRGNYYRWSQRCHRRWVVESAERLCREHDLRLKTGKHVEYIK